MSDRFNACQAIAGITINGNESGQAAILACNGIDRIEEIGGGEWQVDLRATSDDEVFVCLGIGTAAGHAVRRVSETRWSVILGDPGVAYAMWFRVSPGAEGIPTVVGP